MTLGNVITTLHFICNLLMGPTRKSVTLHEARKDYHGQTLLLIGPIYKLLKRVVNMASVIVFKHHILLLTFTCEWVPKSCSVTLH